MQAASAFGIIFQLFSEKFLDKVIININMLLKFIILDDQPD